MKKITLTVLSAIALNAYVASVVADTVEGRFPDHPRNKNHVFTRMFKDLPAFAPQTDISRAAVQQLGAQGGLLDAKDVLTDPILSIINQPVFSPNNPDNPAMTAGMTLYRSASRS